MQLCRGSPSVEKRIRAQRLSEPEPGSKEKQQSRSTLENSGMSGVHPQLISPPLACGIRNDRRNTSDGLLRL